MKLIVWLFLIALTTGCTGSGEPVIEDVVIESIDLNSVEKHCNELGIRPKQLSSITSIEIMRDSVTYKLAGGRMGHKSWFAKFTSDGTELYSYSLEPQVGKKSNAFINEASLWDLWGIAENKLFVDDDKLFLITWFNDGENTSLEDYNSALSILDFTTGKELARLPYEISIDRYTATKSNGYYYILSGRLTYKHLYCVNSDGALEWYRETTVGEKESGLTLYRNYQALNSNLMLFFARIGNAEGLEDIIRVIDLKAYELKLDIKMSDIPFIGELVSEANVAYEFHKAELKENQIHIYYGEYLTEKVIKDEVTGTSELQLNLKNEYYYAVAYPSGKVVGRYKQ